MKRSTTHEPIYNRPSHERSYQPKNYKCLRGQEIREEASIDTSIKDDTSDRYSEETDDVALESLKENEWETESRNLPSDNTFSKDGDPHTFLGPSESFSDFLAG